MCACSGRVDDFGSWGNPGRSLSVWRCMRVKVHGFNFLLSAAVCYRKLCGS